MHWSLICHLVKPQQASRMALVPKCPYVQSCRKQSWHQAAACEPLGIQTRFRPYAAVCSGVHPMFILSLMTANVL